MPVVAAAGLVALGSGWCASYLGVTAAAGLQEDPRERASALGLADLVASGAAASAGIVTGLVVGLVGVGTLTLVVATAMAVVLLVAARPRVVAPAPAAGLR